MPRYRYILITETDNHRVTQNLKTRVELEVQNYIIRGYMPGCGDVIQITCWDGKFALFRRYEDGKLVRILDERRRNGSREYGDPLPSELEMEMD